jgi:rod shape determining protein RodA
MERISSTILGYDTRLFRNFTFSLLFYLIPLFTISTYLIYEINYQLYLKQLIYYFIAFLGFVVAIFIPWRRYAVWIAPLLYFFNLGLLLAVEFVGKTILGAKRWIELPGVGVTIQPSEFIKISVLLMLAYLIKIRPPELKGYRVLSFIKLSIVIVIPFLLIAKEPDLGTALVLLITGFGVLFFIGVNWKIWAVLGIILALSAPILYGQLKPYQKKRISDFIGKPSYHVDQALIAIGSGGMDGKSKEEATQTQLKFLPVSSTDFIFAYLGERFGFQGMMMVILLYIALIIHLISIALRYTKDAFVQVFASGLAFLFFVYMGVNIYMVIGMAPVVGLPLPMFSHGGTSFIIFSVMFGILQHLIAFKDYSRYTSHSKITMIPKDGPSIK